MHLGYLQRQGKADAGTAVRLGVESIEKTVEVAGKPAAVVPNRKADAVVANGYAALRVLHRVGNHIRSPTSASAGLRVKRAVSARPRLFLLNVNIEIISFICAVSDASSL